MAFTNGRVSPETCLVMANLTEEEAIFCKDEDKSLKVSASETEVAAKNEKLTLAEKELLASQLAKFWRDPNKHRQLFHILLLLVAFISVASLSLTLSILFGATGSKCSCSEPRGEKPYIIIHVLWFIIHVYNRLWMGVLFI